VLFSIFLLQSTILQIWAFWPGKEELDEAISILKTKQIYQENMPIYLASSIVSAQFKIFKFIFVFLVGPINVNLFDNCLNNNSICLHSNCFTWL
jgi:hypothetical protein